MLKKVAVLVLVLTAQKVWAQAVIVPSPIPALTGV